jgi:hypothetical protein
MCPPTHQEADDDLVPAAVRKRSRQEAKPLRSQLFLASLKDGITPGDLKC